MSMLSPEAHGVVAPNLGDDSRTHEDHGTTENTEITERKTRRNSKEGTMMEEDQINSPRESKDSGSEWTSVADLRGILSVISVLLIVKILYAVHDFTTDFVARC
jgi:hypothetical protein